MAEACRAHVPFIGGQGVGGRGRGVCIRLSLSQTPSGGNPRHGTLRARAYSRAKVFEPCCELKNSKLALMIC